MTYKFRVTNNFKKVLNRKDKRLRDAVGECLKRLSENPKHPGLNTHKMKGLDGIWEAYVDAGNRVTFHWEDSIIVLRNNCNHDILYRKP